jgi:membrane protease YdiL (CAAX protease family)
VSRCSVKLLLDSSNPMFALAREAKRLPNVAVATLVLMAITVVGFIIPFIAGRLLYGDTGDIDPLMEGNYGYIVPFALIVGALWIWIRVYEKRPFYTLGFTPRAAFLKYFIGFALGFAMQAFTVGLMALSGCVAIEQSGDITPQFAAVGGSLLILVAFVVQGASEEIVCRGWYLPVLGVRYKPWIAVVVTTILFAILHLPSRPVAIINLLLFGLFVALYSLREGSLWGVCGWHTAWNWTMGHVFGLEITGEEPLGETIINLQASGSPLLSGGYGPEGSLAATLIFSVALIGVICGPSRRTKSESDNVC